LASVEASSVPSGLEDDLESLAALSVEEDEEEAVAFSGWRVLFWDLLDSNAALLLTYVVITLDVLLFIVDLVYLVQGWSFQRLLPSFHFPAGTLCLVLDGALACLYTFEVVMRVFVYGRKGYFLNGPMVADFVTVMTSTSLVVLGHICHQSVVLTLGRFLRLGRVATVAVIARERRFTRRFQRHEAELELLLAMEKSEAGKLIKWRIESTSIALGEKMGLGGFGEVYMGIFRGTLVAVKQLFQVNNANSDGAALTIEDEAVTLVNLRHPNVVLFMGFVHEPAKLWIVMEYCSRGSLRETLADPTSRLSPNRILKFALGAARGLAYLHGQDPPVLHLDLKTANILISSGWDAKLADFGLSRTVDNIQNNTFAGTVQYSAPEILEANTFSSAADIYSFGICMWELAARQLPFQGISVMEVLWGVVKENLRPDLSLLASDETGESSDTGLADTEERTAVDTSASLSIAAIAAEAHTAGVTMATQLRHSPATVDRRPSGGPRTPADKPTVSGSGSAEKATGTLSPTTSWRKTAANNGTTLLNGFGTSVNSLVAGKRAPSVLRSARPGPPRGRRSGSPSRLALPLSPGGESVAPYLDLPMRRLTARAAAAAVAANAAMGDKLLPASPSSRADAAGDPSPTNSGSILSSLTAPMAALQPFASRKLTTSSSPSAELIQPGPARRHSTGVCGPLVVPGGLPLEWPSPSVAPSGFLDAKVAASREGGGLAPINRTRGSIDKLRRATTASTTGRGVGSSSVAAMAPSRGGPEGNLFARRMLSFGGTPDLLDASGRPLSFSARHRQAPRSRQKTSQDFLSLPSPLGLSSSAVIGSAKLSHSSSAGPVFGDTPDSVKSLDASDGMTSIPSVRADQTAAVVDVAEAAPVDTIVSAVAPPPDNGAPGAPSAPSCGSADKATAPNVASSCDDRSTLNSKGPDGILPTTMNREYLALIERCWAADPSQRPTANEVVWRLVALLDGTLQFDDSMEVTSPSAD